MPDIDGFELIQQIRQTSGLKDKVVIAASASVYEEDRRQSIDMGGDAFLPKPVVANTLFEQLQRLLDIEWQYRLEDGAETDEAVDFIAPPAETLAHLLDLVQLGDVEELQNQLVALAQADSAYKPFSRTFQHLARAFELNTIKTRLQEYLDESNR